jgi:predicted ATPase
MIDTITLKKFTRFEDIQLKFSPRINVIVGTNGTGKTQLLKAIHALASQHPCEDIKGSLSERLESYFQLAPGDIGTLKRHRSRGKARAELVHATYGSISVNFFGQGLEVTVEHNLTNSSATTSPIFIPTKEVISLFHGLNSPDCHLGTLNSVFDGTYMELAHALQTEPTEVTLSKIQEDPRYTSLIPQLVNLVKGLYTVHDGNFFFQEGSYEEVESVERTQSRHSQFYQDSTTWKFIPKPSPECSSNMTAEGFKKIGVLHRLLSNGELDLENSSSFFWDEPEANLNPALMKLVVEVLLELSRNGQQVIIATHDYALLKWIDLLADSTKGDHVKYHHLRVASGGAVTTSSCEDFSIIADTAISSSFEEIYDADIEKALNS